MVAVTVRPFGSDVPSLNVTDPPTRPTSGPPLVSQCQRECGSCRSERFSSRILTGRFGTKTACSPKVIGAGRYELPKRERFPELRRVLGLKRKPTVEFVLVDMRACELTIKGQEILTADKVAIRASILVQYAVVDPKAALHAVAKYEDRLYSEAQRAARRSLAAMTLEDILTNRTPLGDDILREVKESAINYGVAISRADVKALAFPGNLQEIMNRRARGRAIERSATGRGANEGRGAKD